MLYFDFVAYLKYNAKFYQWVGENKRRLSLGYG